MKKLIIILTAFIAVQVQGQNFKFDKNPLYYYGGNCENQLQKPDTIKPKKTIMVTDSKPYGVDVFNPNEGYGHGITIKNKGYAVVFRDTTDMEVNFTYDGKVEIQGDTIQAIKIMQKNFLQVCEERDKYQNQYYSTLKVIENSVDLINKVPIYPANQKLYKKYLKSLEAYGYYVSKPKSKKRK